MIILDVIGGQIIQSGEGLKNGVTCQPDTMTRISVLETAYKPPYCQHTSFESTGSLLYVYEVSRGRDYPRGHRRSFYTVMSRFNKWSCKL